MQAESLAVKAELLVSLEAPHNVMNADLGLHSLLQFTPEQVYGRSIKFLEGPRTDSVLFHSAIKNAALEQNTTVHLELYGCCGQSRFVIVTSSPYRDHVDSMIGCRLTLESSDAITLREALEEDTCAKALISAENFMIHMVNENFSNLFGLTQGQIMGRTLRTIHGPRTEQSRWTALLHSACRGKRSSEWLYIATSACSEFESMVSCVPVMDAVSSYIANVLVLFTPMMDSAPSHLGSHCAAVPHSVEPSAVKHLNPLHDHNTIFPTFASAQTSEQLQQQHAHLHHRDSPDLFSAASRSQGSCDWFPASQPVVRRTASAIRFPTIIPRHKKQSPTGLDSDPMAASTSRPVEITPDLLDSMAHLTITVAAGKIGVSATALKKACRKLGIDRWPYRKDCPAAARRPAPRDFDEGYVRRLHRKYGPARSASGGASSTAGEPKSGTSESPDTSRLPSSDTGGAVGSGSSTPLFASELSAAAAPVSLAGDAGMGRVSMAAGEPSAAAMDWKMVAHGVGVAAEMMAEKAAAAAAAGGLALKLPAAPAATAAAGTSEAWWMSRAPAPAQPAPSLPFDLAVAGAAAAAPGFDPAAGLGRGQYPLFDTGIPRPAAIATFDPAAGGAVVGSNPQALPPPAFDNGMPTRHTSALGAPCAATGGVSAAPYRAFAQRPAETGSWWSGWPREGLAGRAAAANGMITNGEYGNGCGVAADVLMYAADGEMGPGGGDLGAVGGSGGGWCMEGLFEGA